MSALWIEKGKTWQRCANGCHTGGGYKQGKTKVSLIGRPLTGANGSHTYCDVCVNELVAVYEGAL